MIAKNKWHGISTSGTMNRDHTVMLLTQIVLDGNENAIWFQDPHGNWDYEMGNKQWIIETIKNYAASDIFSVSVEHDEIRDRYNNNPEYLRKVSVYVS